MINREFLLINNKHNLVCGRTVQPVGPSVNIHWKTDRVSCRKVQTVFLQHLNGANCTRLPLAWLSVDILFCSNFYVHASKYWFVSKFRRATKLFWNTDISTQRAFISRKDTWICFDTFKSSIQGDITPLFYNFDLAIQSQNWNVWWKMQYQSDIRGIELQTNRNALEHVTIWPNSRFHSSKMVDDQNLICSWFDMSKTVVLVGRRWLAGQ